MNELPELPIVTGETLKPKTLGPEAFYRLLPELVKNLPGLDRLRERRLERGPVPVPFVYQGNSADGIASPRQRTAES